MGFENEPSGHKSIKRLAESKRVKELLGRYEIISLPQKAEDLAPMLADVKPSGWQPKWILAIDGSFLSHSVQNGYPGAEVGYITISAVLIDAAKQRELDKARPVNPADFRATQEPSSIDEVLPGSNVVFSGQVSARASLRAALMELFREEKNRLSNEGEGEGKGELLLQTYEALLRHKPKDSGQKQRCPYEDDGECGSDAEEKLYQLNTGTYVCNCKFARPLFSTDALRIHESMIPDGPNSTIYTETMQVLERLYLINILRWMETHAPAMMGDVAFVMDGPLGVFGHPAWLSQAIVVELGRLNEKAKSVTGQDILLVGVEKSGAFVEHFERLDNNADGSKGAFPKQRAALLADKYIQDRIVFKPNPNNEKRMVYGQYTYFGRKLFYKTKSGAKLVAVTPFYKPHDRDLTIAQVDQHPRLSDVMSLLDQVVSVRFPNAITPLVEAHAEASIPMNIGTKILERLASEHIK